MLPVAYLELMSAIILMQSDHRFAQMNLWSTTSILSIHHAITPIITNLEKNNLSFIEKFVFKMATSISQLSSKSKFIKV